MRHVWVNISLVLWKKQTLKLPLEPHISGMGCFSASPINFCESKAEQLPNLSASRTIQDDPRGTSSGSPSISWGTAATAPSWRTLGLCFPFLQTSLLWQCCRAASASPKTASLAAAHQESGAPSFKWWVLWPACSSLRCRCQGIAVCLVDFVTAALQTGF